MKTVLKLKVIHIENGAHLIANVKINGKKAMLVVDTGASTTVFDIKAIKKYLKEKSQLIKDQLSAGLGTNTMESHSVMINKLQFGTDLVIVGYDAVLLDLSHANHVYEKLGLPPFIGVLGSDILMDFKAVIDYNKRTLTLNYNKPRKTK